MTDLREIGPTYYFAPPRVFENLLTQVMIRMEDAGALKRWLFQLLHGRRAALRRQDPRRQAGVAAATGCSTRSATCWSTGRCSNALGMSRIRVAYTAGEAIGPDLFRFYRSLGINLKQLYGSTETRCSSACSRTARCKPDTVGTPIAGRRGQDRRQRRGAVSRAPACSRNTTSNPEATAETKRRRRLVPYRRRRLLRRRRAPEDHRPRQGRGQARGRHAVRAEVHREQAQVLPVHQGGGGLRRRARPTSPPSSTSIPRRSATGPSGAASPMPAITDLAAQDRGATS